MKGCTRLVVVALSETEVDKDRNVLVREYDVSWSVEKLWSA